MGCGIGGSEARHCCGLGRQLEDGGCVPRFRWIEGYISVCKCLLVYCAAGLDGATGGGDSDGRGNGGDLSDWGLWRVRTNLVDVNDAATLLGSFGDYFGRHLGVSCYCEPPIDVVVCCGVEDLGSGNAVRGSSSSEDAGATYVAAV